jgi:hypothetical protein
MQPMFPLGVWNEPSCTTVFGDAACFAGLAPRALVVLAEPGGPETVTVLVPPPQPARAIASASGS